MRWRCRRGSSVASNRGSAPRERREEEIDVRFAAPATAWRRIYATATTATAASWRGVHGVAAASRRICSAPAGRLYAGCNRSADRWACDRSPHCRHPVAGLLLASVPWHHPWSCRRDHGVHLTPAHRRKRRNCRWGRPRARRPCPGNHRVHRQRCMGDFHDCSRHELGLNDHPIGLGRD